VSAYGGVGWFTLLAHVFISSWICLAIGSDPPSPGQFGVESSHWKVFVLWLS
jgi:hypothetical protein